MDKTDTYRKLEGLFKKLYDDDPTVVRDSARELLAIEAGCSKRLTYYQFGFRDARTLAASILGVAEDASDVDILVKTFEVAREDNKTNNPILFFVWGGARPLQKAVADALFAIRRSCERNNEVEKFETRMDIALQDKPGLRLVLSEEIELREMAIREPPPAPASRADVSELIRLREEARKKIPQGGTLSEGTVKPPAKKDPPKKGPLKRKR